MRHRNGGFKLGRNTSHRRAMLRNLVTSIILNDRVETTITKCKASRPIVEKMITLGKNGDVHSRRQALAYLMTDASVDAPVHDRSAALLRRGPVGICASFARMHVRAMPRKWPSLSCLAQSTELSEKAQKRTEAREKKREELQQPD